MKHVIYTRDFEPITVIDLPMWASEALAQRGVFWVEVMFPIRIESQELIDPYMMVVCLESQPLRWIDGTMRQIIVAPDDTTALKLKPAWLPGQQGAINAYEQTARALADALMRTLRNG